MRPYNVEIFDTDLTLVCHQNSGDLEHHFDYLSPSSNEVTIQFDENVQEGQYIRIVGNGYDWFGRITGTSSNSASKKLMTIDYESFLNVLDVDILFDTDYQGSGTSLEQVLANYISALYINNADTLQNISGLSVQTSSSTTSWGLHITSDVADSHYAIVNFRDSLVIRAMEKYRIYIDVQPDFVRKTISLVIGAPATERLTIEADLPNVIEKNVVLRQTANNLNKLIVYNEEDYSETVTYYLHSNDEYDTSDSDRITPVNVDVDSTIALEGQTFAAAAQLIAADRFSGRAYSNLIELTVLNDDALINPAGIEYGQEVLIITNGVAYTSYLTGKLIGNTTTLIFGSIRLDLTKILRGGTNGN